MSLKPLPPAQRQKDAPAPDLTLSVASPIGEAMAFVRDYGKTHEYFVSDEVCQAYKDAGLPEPAGGKGWRDKWGGVMMRCVNAGFIRAVGRTVSATRTTHRPFVPLYMSMTFQGERTLMETGHTKIEALRKKWVLRQVKDIRELLWEMYDFAYEQAVSAKTAKVETQKRVKLIANQKEPS